MDYNIKLKSLKNFLGLGLPFWMDSRKSIFTFFLFDFLCIYLIIVNKGSYKYSTLIDQGLFLFTLVWCISSYVSGRYSYYEKFKSKLEKIYNLLIATFLIITIVYILNKFIIIFFPDFISLGKNNTILIFISSFFNQALKFFVFKKKVINSLFFLSGSNKNISFFKKYCKYYISTNKIIFKKWNNKLLSSNKQISVIIIDSNYKDFLNLLSKNIKPITAFNWCEKYLNRIPSKYIDNKNFDLDKIINNPQSFYWRLKRFGDILLSIFLIILSSPIFIIIALLITIEDKGPIFYRQKRTGLYGKTFILTKIRSMKVNSELNGAIWAKKSDPRITRVGLIIRKTRLDELPQLWSVLIGDMSLIGPRPERPEIDRELINAIPYYSLRNTLKPGLSGWAQINYKYGASFKDAEAKLSYEIFYIRNQSFLLDILIFFKTIKLIINMEGSEPS